MPYTKIKHNKGTTTLTRVEDRSQQESIEQTLTSHDDPRPAFVEALQALTAYVVRVCELPRGYAEDMRITGVSLSPGEYGGCVVTALKSVSGANAPVVINTPHVPEVATSDNGPCLPPWACEMLATLEAEADRFWKGERAQVEMFTESGEVQITEPYTPPNGSTATLSVNGGPAVDLDDEAAVREALTPLFEELAGKVHP